MTCHSFDPLTGKVRQCRLYAGKGYEMITFRRLQRMTSRELDEELKDGVVLVMVDGKYRYEIRRVYEQRREDADTEGSRCPTRDCQETNAGYLHEQV